MAVTEQQLHDLLYQALETELGGVEVYKTALGCATNDDLRKEWEQYHEQTTHHVELVEGALEAFGLDPGAETPGRRVVRHTGQALVKAIELARADGSPAQAPSGRGRMRHPGRDQGPPQLGAHRRGRDPSHRRAGESATRRAQRGRGRRGRAPLPQTGWARELWIAGLGLPAALPPPEEQKDVKTAIGAARAKQQRREFA